MTLVFLTLISRPQNPLALEKKRRKKKSVMTTEMNMKFTETLTLLHHTVLTDLWDISLLSSRCSSARTHSTSVCLPEVWVQNLSCTMFRVICPARWKSRCAGFRFLSPGFSPLPWIRLDSRPTAGAANRTRRATSSVSLRVWKIARLSFFPHKTPGRTVSV